MEYPKLNIVDGFMVDRSALPDAVTRVASRILALMRFKRLDEAIVQIAKSLRVRLLRPLY